MRRRGDVLLRAIYDAALAELAATGLGGLTMDGIATRSRAARTSLYRRWRTPEQLVLEALDRTMPEQAPAPDTGDLRADLLAELRELCSVLAGPIGPALVTLFGERHRRPDLIEALDEKVLAPRGELGAEVLDRAVRGGVIRSEVVTPLVADVGFVQVFFHYLAYARPPDDDELAAIVDQLVLPALRLPPGG